MKRSGCGRRLERLSEPILMVWWAPQYSQSKWWDRNSICYLYVDFRTYFTVNGKFSGTFTSVYYAYVAYIYLFLRLEAASSLNLIENLYNIKRGNPLVVICVHPLEVFNNFWLVSVGSMRQRQQFSVEFGSPENELNISIAIL